MKSSKCISDVCFYHPFIWCCQCRRVLTLTLWLDIINYIWIKLWFGISPDEDRRVLDKKCISVHRWFCFLWSNGSPRVVPRLRVSAPPVRVRNADSQDLGHISGIRNSQGGTQPSVFYKVSWWCLCTLRSPSVRSHKWWTREHSCVSHLPPHDPTSLSFARLSGSSCRYVG